MRKHIVLLFMLIQSILLISVTGNAQKENKEFERFANINDSLCRKAYKTRDTSTFRHLIDEFLTKYNHLDSLDKKMYSENLYNDYYNLCCAYSLLDKKTEAIKYFEVSYNAGFHDYPHLAEDSDLNNIRNEEGFKKTASKMRGTGDYMYILKRAYKYNDDDDRKLPQFTYQSSDNPHLAELRKAFKLDSVAGGGNEVSRIISLLHFIHNLIPHDGNHGNPEVKNAMNMIAECKKDNKGLNCRGLATVLNECYLAMGFKSRIVTCLPKDSLHIDMDCHVITMVYVTSLKKWVWMDPTFDAYIMNENGELLSIAEVRERLIEGKPLILNPDANWNHKSSQTKKGYLENYMAKNLYMLECPVSSEYNMETREDGKTIRYIKLLPLDYFKQSPDMEKDTYQNTTYIVYKTNNPIAFWQTPEN